MILQKFIICTFKNPDNSTYEGAAITEESYNSASFRANFELKIKKARLVGFDTEEYRELSGLTKEQVDQLKPKPVEVKTNAKVEAFKFPTIANLENNSTPKLPQVKEVKKRGRKPKTAA